MLILTANGREPFGQLLQLSAWRRLLRMSFVVDLGIVHESIARYTWFVLEGFEETRGKVVRFQSFSQLGVEAGRAYDVIVYSGQ